MPAYSFKERFVPWVKDGSKPGTIRGFRKYPVKPGQFAHLFYGMRTKHCIKLLTPSPAIKNVQVIYIGAFGEIALIDSFWFDQDFVEWLKMKGEHEINKLPGVKWLTTAEKDLLAWNDGFRSSQEPNNEYQCNDIMFRYWRFEVELPFIGNYIQWGESTKTAVLDMSKYKNGPFGLLGLK